MTFNCDHLSLLCKLLCSIIITWSENICEIGRGLITVSLIILSHDIYIYYLTLKLLVHTSTYKTIIWTLIFLNSPLSGTVYNWAHILLVYDQNGKKKITQNTFFIITPVKFKVSISFDVFLWTWDIYIYILSIWIINYLLSFLSLYVCYE